MSTSTENNAQISWPGSVTQQIRYQNTLNSTLINLVFLYGEDPVAGIPITTVCYSMIESTRQGSALGAVTRLKRRLKDEAPAFEAVDSDGNPFPARVSDHLFVSGKLRLRTNVRLAQPVANPNDSVTENLYTIMHRYPSPQLVRCSLHAVLLPVSALNVQRIRFQNTGANVVLPRWLLHYNMLNQDEAKEYRTVVEHTLSVYLGAFYYTCFTGHDVTKRVNSAVESTLRRLLCKEPLDSVVVNGEPFVQWLFRRHGGINTAGLAFPLGHGNTFDLLPRTVAYHSYIIDGPAIGGERKHTLVVRHPFPSIGVVNDLAGVPRPAIDGMTLLQLLRKETRGVTDLTEFAEQITAR